MIRCCYDNIIDYSNVPLTMHPNETYKPKFSDETASAMHLIQRNPYAMTNPRLITVHEKPKRATDGAARFDRARSSYTHMDATNATLEAEKQPDINGSFHPAVDYFDVTSSNPPRKFVDTRNFGDYHPISKKANEWDVPRTWMDGVGDQSYQSYPYSGLSSNATKVHT